MFGGCRNGTKIARHFMFYSVLPPHCWVDAVFRCYLINWCTSFFSFGSIVIACFGNIVLFGVRHLSHHIRDPTNQKCPTPKTSVILIIQDFSKKKRIAFDEFSHEYQDFPPLRLILRPMVFSIFWFFILLEKDGLCEVSTIMVYVWLCA